MLSPESNERLTRVGPGTPCGELMRRYWIPIAPCAQLLENPVRRVRVLGEDLVLFRDRAGSRSSANGACTARRMNTGSRTNAGCAVPIMVGCTAPRAVLERPREKERGYQKIRVIRFKNSAGSSCLLGPARRRSRNGTCRVASTPSGRSRSTCSIATGSNVRRTPEIRPTASGPTGNCSIRVGTAG